MGIGDDVYFYGPKDSQYKQVGNSICPLIGLAIGKCFLDQCIKVCPRDLPRDFQGMKRVAELQESSSDMDSGKRRRMSFE
jgi:hypothetical protein